MCILNFTNIPSGNLLSLSLFLFLISIEVLTNHITIISNFSILLFLFLIYVSVCTINCHFQVDLHIYFLLCLLIVFYFFLKVIVLVSSSPPATIKHFISVSISNLPVPNVSNPNFLIKIQTLYLNLVLIHYKKCSFFWNTKFVQQHKICELDIGHKNGFNMPLSNTPSVIIVLN